MNSDLIYFKSIPDVADYYKAGSDGNIYSFYNGKQKILKPSKSSSGLGYFQVSITINKDRRSRSVHDLVCSAFHGEKRDRQLVVAHLDGDKYNNTPSNLKWITQKENLNMKFEHGTHDSGTYNTRASLNKEELFVVRWLLSNTKVTHQEIASILKVSRVTITKVANRNRYGNISVKVKQFLEIKDKEF